MVKTDSLQNKISTLVQKIAMKHFSLTVLQHLEFHVSTFSVAVPRLEYRILTNIRFYKIQLPVC